MKLRNKNTGEVIESACIGVFKHQSSGDCERVDTEARSLEKVLEVWEDYKPTEPLIKDEKVRKAVRAWAEANNIERVSIQNNYCLSSEDGDDAEIVFVKPVFKDVDDEDFRTIAELCGEEK